MPASTRLLTSSGPASRRIARESRGKAYEKLPGSLMGLKEPPGIHAVAGPWGCWHSSGSRQPCPHRRAHMLVGSQPRRVAVIGGARIPFARAQGAYASVGNQEMLTAALKGVVDKFQLRGALLGDVVAGAVMKHSSQWNLTREALLDSGLAPETPGLDVQRACGTSLEATIAIANKIALGQIDAGIAGGVDTASDPPVVFGREYQQLLL